LIDRRRILERCASLGKLFPALPRSIVLKRPFIHVFQYLIRNRTAAVRNIKIIGCISL